MIPGTISHKKTAQRRFFIERVTEPSRLDVSAPCITVGRGGRLSGRAYPPPEHDTCPSDVDARHADQPEHESQKECAAANLADQHGIFLPKRRKNRNGKGGTGKQNRRDEHARET